MRREPKRARHAAGWFDGLVVDNFAGGGGASLGIERALGRSLDAAINHDPEAVAMHRLNHPHTRHYCESVWTVSPLEITQGRPVSLCWFSPDCKHFSSAKGGKPVEKKIRGLAWVVVRWAKRVQPRIIMLENVREFLTWGPLVNGRPCPARKGLIFRRWTAQLRKLGYEVEWKVLDAADFGAPTHRRRLFLVARRDGEPIRWPEPTHRPGRSKPYRTAAECLDWSLPCLSIFLSREEAKTLGVKRPLAEKTLRRIAMGLKRYVFESRPYVVSVNHGRDLVRGQSIDAPLATVTASQGFAAVTPLLTAAYGEAPHQETRGQRVDEPIRTVTPRSGGGFSLVAPHVTKYFGGVVGQDCDRPMPTITAVDHNGIVSAVLAGVGGRAGQSNPREVDRPAATTTAKADTALVSANMVRLGQAGGNGAYVNPAEEPLGTIVSKAEACLCASSLIRMNHGDVQWAAVSEPLRTILAGANHHGLTVARLDEKDSRDEVLAFLAKYYGKSFGQRPDEPIGTLMSKDRFGVVMIRGEPYQVIDIGLRMLTPRELYRCQGFPDSYQIDPEVDGRRLPKRAQVRMVGNSVCPQMSEALVRVNLPEECLAKGSKRQPRAVLDASA